MEEEERKEGREEEDVERTTKVSDLLPLSRRLATRHVILAGRWSLTMEPPDTLFCLRCRERY